MTLSATDPGGLTTARGFTVMVRAGARDYDADNDGLIEVRTLAQLDALRYELDGDGLVDGATWMPYYAAFTMGALGMGCPDGCTGYELEADLDFDTDGDGAVDSDDDYWNNSDGCEPIGGEGSVRGNLAMATAVRSRTCSSSGRPRTKSAFSGSGGSGL